MQVIYHDAVEADLVEAALFYESRESGLSTRFFDSFDAAIAVIHEAPQRWAIVDDDAQIRRYRMSRFPFGIEYRVDGELVKILTVKHLRRHPDFGSGRR